MPVELPDLEWLLDRCRHVPMEDAISLADHLLSTASRLADSGGADSTIVAGLFHDIGHLFEVEPHAVIGAKWLARWFPPEVTTPVSLHVAVKEFVLTGRGEPWHNPSAFEEIASFATLNVNSWNAAIDVRRAESLPVLRYAPSGSSLTEILEIAYSVIRSS